MRVFLALELPGPIREYLSTVAKLMSQRVSGVKWVKTDALHVTLKFLGQMEERKVQGIGEALEGINEQHTVIPVQLKEISAFPDLMRPKVVVVTFQEGVDNMKAIFHDIESRLLTVGIEREKREFASHITIGRVKEAAPLLKKNVIPLEEKRFLLGSLVLYQSTLAREGALYTRLKEIKLERNIE
jgi:RNA 2',3'-cyclic 3'-phosphodiesterase